VISASIIITIILFTIMLYTWLQVDIHLQVEGTSQRNVVANSLSVEIHEPELGSTIVLDNFWVNGTSRSDLVEKIEVLVQKYPFDDIYDYEPANPVSPNNWSTWSFQARINETGYYMIQAYIVDESGNENWTQSSINVPFLYPTYNETMAHQTKIALVDSSFTNSAYGPNAFYDFYPKYQDTPVGVEVKDDLDLLTAPIFDPPEIDIYAEVNTSDFANLVDLSEGNEKDYFMPFATQIKQIFPDSITTVIRDEDIHNGRIFLSNGSNAFDILVLFHEEYMTQEGYDFLRQFAFNGGTMILLDGNIFYAEVDYDKINKEITLVKGHDWEFDGSSAKKNVAERWLNENREWMGSGFLVSEINDNITFSNNPFNYSHFEENFITNPNVDIIHDYQVNLPINSPYRGVTVGTYSLEYGSGMIIMLGIYAQNLHSDLQFMDFLSSLLTEHVK